MLPIENLAKLSPERRAHLLERGKSRLEDLRPAVETIIAGVKERGDTALIDYTQQFDKVTPTELRVPPDDIQRALLEADPSYVKALHIAAQQITNTHRVLFNDRNSVVNVSPQGVSIWTEWRAIERVGIYVPGGKTLYPSCLLMGALPAKVAGCDEIVVCTPPGPDGRVPAELLAAAFIAGVTEVYAVGGAQAIAAMAYGTQTIRAVDKIFGPGSSYVAAAKLRVSMDVAIDMPAGPSEIFILADENANPEWVAADLLAQSEHGPESAAVLVTNNEPFAHEVAKAMEAQIETLATSDTIRESLRRNGALIVAQSSSDAIKFTNAYAPEHLSIQMSNGGELVSQIKHAGSVFVGRWTPVAAGDYATGGNHTLPTAGYARSYSALSVEAFGRRMQVQSLEFEGLNGLHETVEQLATTEHLPAHAASVARRFAGKEAPDEAAWVDRALEFRSQPSDKPTYLNSNENPRGVFPPERARTLGQVGFTRYPDMTQAGLRQALADLVNMHAVARVTPEQIMAGNGSDEVIHLISLMTLKHGDEVIVCEPTFGIYRFEAELIGAEVINVPLDADFRIDRAALLDAITPRTKLVWLCSPNNPTGTDQDISIVPEIAARGPLVVVDEAYYPFSDVTALPYLETTPNLIIMRTLSKWAGLAGLRLGYAIASPEIIAKIDARRHPFNVNWLAETAARSTVEAFSVLEHSKASIIAERERVAREVATLPGVRVWPSAANFLLIEFPVADASVLQKHLEEQGVMVRYLRHERLRSCLRVSIGMNGENDTFLEKIQVVLAEVAR